MSLRHSMLRNITRADIRFFVGLLVVHTIFFVIALYYKRIYNGDSHEYIYMALNIRDHFDFYAGSPALPRVEEYMTLRTPLYSMLMALVYVFAVNNWVILLFQNLLSIFNIYYMRDTIRKIGYSRKYDWVLIAFVMIYPAQFIHANTIAPDLLLQTAVLVYFRHFILLVRRKEWRQGLWMSCALIAGMMLKPVLYPFAYIHIFVLIGMASYVNRGLMKPFIAGLLPIFVVLLYSFWNYSRTGTTHYSSNQSLNAVSYYYYYFAKKEGLPKAQAFLQQERAEMNSYENFSDRYKYANQRGVALLKDNFWPYMTYHIQRSIRMFVDPGKGDFDMFTNRATLGGLYSGTQGAGFYAAIKDDGMDGFERYMEQNPTVFLAFIVLLFNAFKIIGLFLYLFHRRTNKYIKLLVVLLLGYFAITTGPIANTRYFMPISLIVIGCATVGFKHYLHWRKYKVIITGS